MLKQAVNGHEEGQISGTTGPVGQGDHVVEPGDSLESIAFKHGFFPETLLNHSSNADLKKLRPDHNALLPGDRITVPGKSAKELLCAANQRHKFRRKGVPSVVRIRLYEDGKPRANQKYTLEVDGQTFHGVTSGDGLLEQYVPPAAKQGRLEIGEDQAVFALQFGLLDPVSEITGIQNRLTNLGFDCGPFDGAMNAATVRAIKAFQKSRNLEITGSVDQKLRDALKDPFTAAH